MVMKSLSILSIVTAILAPVGVSLASVSPAANSSFNPPVQISLEFPPAPTDSGSPKSTTGGATRGNTCIIGNTELMALVPSKKTSTVSANPTFYVYVPEAKVKQGNFILVDKEGNDVYTSTIELPAQPSIVQIDLPRTIALGVGQEYTWQFLITCIANDQGFEQEVAHYATVEIKRTELSPDLQTKIEQTKDPLEKAKLYASQQIWQDTLMIMADLRASKQKEWEQLLTSVGLGNLVTVPFAEALAPTAQNPEPQ